MIEKRNKEKANMLYDFIDSTKMFDNFVTDKKSRSMMNVVFFMDTKENEEEFYNFACKRDIVGIKCHKYVGKGFRVSLYNALPINHVKYLIEVMKEFITIKNNIKIMNH